MPDELDKLLNDRASEQQEFEDVFEDILGKTDEEIEESLRKEKEKEALGEAGDATKDPKNGDSGTEYAFGKEQKPDAKDPEAGVATKPTSPDTSGQETDWQKKALEAEDELKKERQRTASWDGRIKAANEKTKTLEAQVATLLADKTDQVKAKTAAQDLSDKEKMELFKDNFPELHDFADILQRKMDSIKPVEELFPAKVDPITDPVVEEDPKTTPAGESSEHYKSMTKVHPDLDEMVNTGVLLTWINGQPEYIRSHLQAVYNKGNAEDVIKMATEFKRSTGWKSGINQVEKIKQDKLDSMRETQSQSGGPKAEAPDKNDFAAAAKEAGL
jgi:hypothetical protein